MLPPRYNVYGKGRAMRYLTVGLSLFAVLLAPSAIGVEVRYKPLRRQYQIGKRPLLPDEEEHVPRPRIKGSGTYERAHNARKSVPRVLGPVGTAAPKVPPRRRR